MTDQILKADPIVGLSDRNTVMLDLDDVSFRTARYWALRAYHWFRLKGFIILKSSKKSYHVVFDRYVSREENLRVVAWVGILSKSVPLLRYLAMQCIKMSSTLRVAPKGNKPSPRIAFRYGSQDDAIKDFLKFRRLIKGIYRKF